MTESGPSLLPHEEPIAPRIDLCIAAVFLAIGITIFVLSLQMPTYAEQKGEFYQRPGLVPALYGAVIALLSIWLGVRSLRRGALTAAGAHRSAPRTGYSNARLAASAVLGLIYAVGMIGRLPFWLATTLFIFAFTTLFEWRADDGRSARNRKLLIAATIAIVASIAITVVFEKLFLVRLP
jgi:hypothetical protein